MLALFTLRSLKFMNCGSLLIKRTTQHSFLIVAADVGKMCAEMPGDMRRRCAKMCDEMCEEQMCGDVRKEMCEAVSQMYENRMHIIKHITNVHSDFI